MIALRSILLIGILTILTVLGFNPMMVTQTAKAKSYNPSDQIEKIDSIKENYLINHQEKDRIKAEQGKKLGQVFREQGQAIGKSYKKAGRDQQKQPEYQSLTLEQIYQNWGKGLY